MPDFFDVSSGGAGKSSAVASRPKPSQKQLVSTLATVKKQRMMKAKSNGLETPHNCILCPKGDDCKEVKFSRKESAEYCWPAGTGWQNPYFHLKQCCYHGNETAMLQDYWATIDRRNGFVTASGATSVYSTRVQAIHDWIELIVAKDLPLSVVEDKTFRSFSKHSGEPITRAYLKKVMFKMVQLIEPTIGQLMQDAGIGAIMYDGWTKDSVHYIGIIACFMRQFPVYKYGKMVEYKQELEQILLSVAPMVRDPSTIDDPDYDEDQVDVLACEFNASQQLKHFERILPMYGHDFHEWCVCLLGDNASVNLKTAELAEMPHIGCKNHKLNLEVNNMVKRNDARLDALLNKLQRLMTNLKTMKNSASLKTFTPLKPQLYNKTRWSGKYKVIRKFVKIRSALLHMSEDDNNEFVLEPALRTNTLLEKAVAYKKMLQSIDYTTRFLQHKGISLFRAQDALNDLVEFVKEGNAASPTMQHPLKHCKLEDKWIGRDSAKLASPHFHNGIIKLQSKMTGALTEEEKEAVARLKTSSSTTSTTSSDDSPGRFDMANRLAKRQKTAASVTDGYANADFVLGSCAEIERVWSSAERILRKTRYSLTPIYFETILLLKYNRKFWDMELVSKAIRCVQVEDHTNRLADELAAVEIQCVDEDASDDERFE
jgi:hypothetical protein